MPRGWEGSPWEEEGEAAVRTTTGCGTWRIRWRTEARRSCGFVGVEVGEVGWRSSMGCVPGRFGSGCCSGSSKISSILSILLLRDFPF
jgi:hypothetical protein